MLLVAAVLLATTPPAPLKAIGPWAVRYEQELCLLERTYSAGPPPTTLMFQPMFELPNVDLIVVGPGSPGGPARGTYTVRVGPQAAPVSGPYVSFDRVGEDVRITRLSMRKSAFEKLKDGDVLEIDAKPVQAAFLISKPEIARAELVRCGNDLKQNWGLDLAVEKQISTPVQLLPTASFLMDDYPTEAMRKRLQGRVITMLNVDTAGKITSCRVLSSPGTELNEATCKSARRARFRAARDKDGRPLPSFYILPVSWNLPTDM